MPQISNTPIGVFHRTRAWLAFFGLLMFVTYIGAVLYDYAGWVFAEVPNVEAMPTCEEADPLTRGRCRLSWNTWALKNLYGCAWYMDGQTKECWYSGSSSVGTSCPSTSFYNWGDCIKWERRLYLELQTEVHDCRRCVDDGKDCHFVPCPMESTTTHDIEDLKGILQRVPTLLCSGGDCERIQ